MRSARCSGAVAGGGSSAGAAIMSTTMFRDPPDNPHLVRLKPGRDIDRSLGFVTGVFVDQHSSAAAWPMLPLMVQAGFYRPS
jgi:cyanophycinase